MSRDVPATTNDLFRGCLYCHSPSGDLKHWKTNKARAGALCTFGPCTFGMHPLWVGGVWIWGASQPINGLKIVFIGDTRDSQDEVVTSIPMNFTIIASCCIPIFGSSQKTPHWGGYLPFLHGVGDNGVNPESIGQLPRLLPILYGKKASRRATSGNRCLGRRGIGVGQERWDQHNKHEHGW